MEPRLASRRLSIWLVHAGKIAYTIDVSRYRKCSQRKGRKMRKEIGDTTKKKISIGVEDFKEIIVKDGYFVDKTLMIKKLIEKNAKLTLFMRPRRF